ncbi:MAG: hypothetical protein RLZZ155_1044 [Bacteroidota bacterium]|jgi:hypothetical protein
MSKTELQIASHFESLPPSKSHDLQLLHSFILSINPACKLWFDNGINDDGKVVANPTIGYGALSLQYANGTSRDFFQIGICSTSTGISVYIIGLKDKLYLKEKFASSIGKASVTGYCVKFKAMKDINENVLKELITFGFSERTN